MVLTDVLVDLGGNRLCAESTGAISTRHERYTSVRVKKVVWPPAKVEPYRRVGSELTGGRYQDLEQMWTTCDGQEHFTPEGFEQGDGSWEKILTRALLERDIFWTYAQGEA